MLRLEYFNNIFTKNLKWQVVIDYCRVIITPNMCTRTDPRRLDLPGLRKKIFY